MQTHSKETNDIIKAIQPKIKTRSVTRHMPGPMVSLSSSYNF